ncbi:MLO-like protein 3 [Primulina tabacum]|uniref:MLO-like protein 3 n=1 Tax=Primulina tabacum TaxID=48773 RepID=UPI003F59D33F
MLPHSQMKRWKAWEKETQTVEYMAANDPERFRYARQTTFGRRHVRSDGSNSALLWINLVQKCFLRQFFHSVAKIDSVTLRHGFISAHLSTNNSFNFQKYIQRSLEDDFKAVVGISPVMWFVVVIFLLVDVHGWNAYLWVSFLPLIIVLVIGTKLEVIVARMAMQLTNQNTVIKGSPLVQPNNNLFWFNRPQLVLTLLHFILYL